MITAPTENANASKGRFILRAPESGLGSSA
jgi:hypothetical protein